MALDKWTWKKDFLAQITDEEFEAAEAARVQEDSLQEGSYDIEQVKSLCEKELNFLAAIAMPTVFEVAFPPMHLAAWQLLCQSVTDKIHAFPQLALGIPRGHAKTTLIKLFALWCILFTNKKFILVISSTADLAVNIVSDIADMLNEENIKGVFGDWKLGMEVNRQDLKKFSFRGRSIIIAAIGSGGSMRGLNIKNQRPDVMLFDDIQTRECADSRQQSELLERWMIGTAMKAKSPRDCCFIFAGNMYPTPNSILRKLKDNPTWIKFISGAILADGTAIWPELRSIESLIQELDNDISLGHPEIFFSEVLNDIEAGTNSRVDLALIRDWKWTDQDKPQGKFIIIDPASNKVGGDDVAIGYCEVYDAVPALREVIEQNLSPGNTIKQALILALRTGTRVIAVESTAYQFSLLYWFDFIAQQFGITNIHFVEVYTGNYSKNARITDMLKTLTAGDIIIHPQVKSHVTHQIAHWNPMKRNNNDGVLDLLSYMPRVLELYSPLLATNDSVEMQEGGAASVVENNFMF